MNCPSCGRENPPTARFCQNCAAPLENRTAIPEGERKRVTVLFADIAGSMALAAGRDPEDTRAILDGAIERMMEAVHESGGTVNQVLGDGIMALFGAPLAQEDHAVRACVAAVRMQALMQAYARELERAAGIALRIRVGLNTGDVVVRAIAADMRMDYTAVGSATHLAARMEQMAAPGTILATGVTARLAEGYVQMRPAGVRAVKGLPQPVETFEVLAAAPGHTRFLGSLRRGLSRFVGRESELAQLEEARESAARGSGRLLGIMGEPGLGKSRLVWEFVRRAREGGWTVLSASADPHATAHAFRPLVEALSGYFQVEAADGADAARSKVGERLEALDPALLPLATPLLALLDRPTADPRWLQLDPPQRRLRVVDAVKTLLLRQARAEPTLIVVADLHWADTGTLELLDSLAGAIARSHLLAVVEYRPEYRHRWGALEGWSQVDLAPLPDDNARALFRALAANAPGVLALEAPVLRKTGGNPFFLEESVRALVETGAASVDALPDTVHDVLAARIDRLGEDEKSLLQLAAVGGVEVEPEVLAQVAGLSRGALRERLARLVQSGFLAQSGRFPSFVIAFKHAFTHDVALGSLLQQRRRQLHARTLQAIESLYAGRLLEQVEPLAHHAVQGEQWTAAAGYLRIAARRAIERSAYREAVAHLEQALAALGRWPEGRDAARAGIDVRLEMRNAFLALGQFERMFERLREADQLAEAHGDAARRARVAVHLTGYFWLAGRHEAAEQASLRTLAVAAPLKDPQLIVPTRFYLAAARHAMADYRRSNEMLEVILGGLDGSGERYGLSGVPEVLARGIRIWSAAELGDFESAFADAAVALRIADESGHPFSMLTATFVTSVARLARGELEAAVGLMRRGLAMCRSERLPMWYPPFASLNALALAHAGRVGEAVPMMEKILPARPGPISFAPFAVVASSEVYLLAGQRERAQAQAERALELARAKAERTYEVWALRALGELAATAATPDIPGAEKSYGAALAKARALGLRPLEARCHLGLGQLRARAGAKDAARESLGAAAGMFNSMGMSFWAERARSSAG